MSIEDRLPSGYAEEEPRRSKEPQWRVELLQVVNWGGFQGKHALAISDGATLISGSSGSGKSTLLDAYIAVMMSFDVPFNGASNEGGGRARGADQRSLPSYLRGKLDDTTDTVDGGLRAKVLRGAHEPTWGAIAVTFASDAGGVFTALRAYYLAPTGRTNSDVLMKMATIDARIDIADLSELAVGKFDKRDMEKRYPGMRVTTKYGEFSTDLFTRMGIGAHADGTRAFKLLARIQAGHEVKAVDDLYKALVLERPSTYLAADKAIDHFEDLDAAYEAMRDEEAKAKELDGIEARHDELTAAREAIDLIDTFRLHSPGDTPLTLWANLKERDMLEAAESAAKTAERAHASAHTAAAAREADLNAQRDAIEEQRRAAGGDKISVLDHEIERQQAQRIVIVDSRAAFDRHTAALAIPNCTEQEFADAKTRAEEFLSTYDQQADELSRAHRDLGSQGHPVTARYNELRDERASLQGRAGRVTPDMHARRLEVAKAAGMSPDAFPYVAELLDIPSEHAEWTMAIEVALAGIARVMIIDQTQLERVSAAIDPIIMRRFSFNGVERAPHQERYGDPAKISGKVSHKPGPYSHWVASRIGDEGNDALTVSGPEQLAGPGRRITRAGQLRHGRSGSHGVSRSPNIIGFSNESRLAEIDEQMRDLKKQTDEHDALVAELERRSRHLGDLRAAHQHVAATTWRSIDIDANAARISELVKQRQRIIDSSDTLAALDAEHARVTRELAAATTDRVTAAGMQRTANETWGRIAEQRDAVSNEIERVEILGTPVLSEDQRTELDAQYARLGSGARPDRHELFADDLSRIREQLNARLREHQDKERRAIESLEATFARYNSDERWHDNDRGTTVREYPVYKEILDVILTKGLAQRRQEWARSVNTWTGEDLVPLSGAYEAAIGEIRDRLVPVNQILETVPFGAHGYRLKIELTETRNDEVAEFRKELRLLAGGATEDLTEAETLKRFLRLRSFLDQLRDKPKVIRRDGTPTPTRRDILLDVRKHAEITAAAYEGNERRATYASLGGKSGGETQELIAFIVGAALRYQLGGEGNARPTFAPVLLDEAFIKADSEFAGRAVSAWKKLGFQLIIGAPLDKVTGLEPHMDKLVSIAKSPRGYSHITDATTTNDPARAHLSAARTGQ